MEGHDATIVKRENLAIEHHIRVEVESRGGDLWELSRDVLQVAAVQRCLAAASVELASDTVILVFNPDVLAESCHRLFRARDRRREHRPQGHEPARRRRIETARTREQGGLTEVS